MSSDPTLPSRDPAEPVSWTPTGPDAAPSAVATAPPPPASSLPGWPPAGPPPEPVGRVARPGKARQFVVGVVVGALVGGAVAAGVVAATDDDSTSVSRPVATSPQIVSRPAREIEQAGGIASIIARAEPAIVAITTDEGPGSGQGNAGTGFVITSDGYIVTNNHVVAGADRIRAAFTNGDERSARIVGRDPSNDLAVVKVDAENLPTVDLATSEVQVGDEVIAIGNALALEGGLSVTRGIISGLDRDVATNVDSSLVGLLQTDAAINPGNSGGPLLDAQGRVIGINTAIANPASAQNVGFAIPISNALPIIDDLRLGRTPAYLGVATRTVTPAVARELELSVQQGAFVTEAAADEPAGEAGVRRGDVIVEIDGKAVTQAPDVQSAVRSHRPGDTVQVVVVRDGSRKTLEATLTRRPEGG